MTVKELDNKPQMSLVPTRFLRLLMHIAQDPEVAYGLSLLEPELLTKLAKVLFHGAKKYGPEAWKEDRDAQTIYADALFRHWLLYMEGQVLDTTTGLPHMAHVAANAMFLLHFDEAKRDTDL